jgi:hypothetical protein
MCGETVIYCGSVSTVSLSLEAISEMTIFKGKRFRGCTNEALSLPVAVDLNDGAVFAFNISS